MILGIDLGTTKSAVGVFQNGTPFIIPDRMGYLSIPSLVSVTPDEEIIVGRSAQKHPDHYKSKNVTISSVKRMMGRNGETGWGWWKTYPQEVSAFILAELKSQAERYLGKEIKKTVIAVPSHFDENQRNATKEAAEIAGLEPVRLLNEATATALTYSFYNKFKERKVLVFDFGGGTLDVSIVDTGGGVIQVRCTEGDSKLGGDDFDKVIIDYILEKLQQKYSTEIIPDTAQKVMLKEVAEMAKIELSNKSVASIHIPGFLSNRNAYYDLDISIDRQTFERLSENLFERTDTLLNNTLVSAGIKPSYLDAVLLVGGSSRIPYVRNLVKNKTGIEPFTGVDPMTCVAEGAALQAGIMKGNIKNVILVDVIPSSYGIALDGDVFSKIIEKNNPVPTSKTRIFTTSEDNQSTITINVYQGEEPIASDNTYLSTIELQNVPPYPRGVPQIEITFAVDENMTVYIDAKDKGTSRKQHIAVTSPYKLNDAQIRIMKEKLNLWRVKRRTQETKHLVKPLESSIRDLLKENSAILEWDVISMLRKCIILLDDLPNKEISHKKLERLISSAQDIYEQANLCVIKYKTLINEINELETKIDRVTFMLKTVNPDESNLLVKGKMLLYDTANKKPPYRELQSIFLSVQSEYVNAKSNLVKILLESLKTSGQMRSWLSEAHNSLSNLYSLNRYLLKLRRLKEVNAIIAILETESSKYQKLIWKQVIKKVKKEPAFLTCFIIITVTFTGFFIESDIKDLLSNDKIGYYIALPLFNEFYNNEISEQRVLVAKIIAESLPTNCQYLPIIVDCLDTEPNETVKKYLVSYLNKQPPGNFHEFFKNAGSEIKGKIENNKEMLTKLAQEPDEKVRIIAIEKLFKFPINEIMDIFLSFINDENPVIRAKTFALTKNKNFELSEIIRQALQDTSSKIRLLALDYIQQSGDDDYLSDLITLLKVEVDEVVIKKVIAVLDKLKRSITLPLIFNFLIENNAKANPYMVFYLKLNDKLMDENTKKLLNLIIKVKEQKQSLTVKDKIFLWHFVKKHEEMKQAIENLKRINNGSIK